MFRLLEFIVLFLLAYKLFNELFVRRAPKKMEKEFHTPPRPMQEKKEPVQHTSTNYDNAEIIDYEEVK